MHLLRVTGELTRQLTPRKEKYTVICGSKWCVLAVLGMSSSVKRIIIIIIIIIFLMIQRCPLPNR